MYRALLPQLSLSHTSRCFVLCFLAIPMMASDAEAQSPEAMSEAFFDEAIVLRNAGQWHAACNKFLQSQKLAGARGTLQNLGECNAKLGKLASAWGYYKELLGTAEVAGDHARMLVATTQLAALRDQVPKLTLEVGVSEDIAGLSITLNGEALARVLYGESAMRDPGHYLILATAPGHVDWSTEIDIQIGQSYTVNIPRFQAHPPQVPNSDLPDRKRLSTSSESATDTNPPNHTMAYLAGGLGIAALGVGSYFGLMAKADLDRADADHCDNERRCDAQGVLLVQSGQASANWSTAAFVLGGATLTAGVVLYLRGNADSSDKTSVTARISPAVQAGGASLLLSGGF